MPIVFNFFSTGGIAFACVDGEALGAISFRAGGRRHPHRAVAEAVAVAGGAS